LGRALEQLSSIADDEGARCDLLVEAAQAAARAQDARTAVQRAQRAAKLAPKRASAQLYARGLEYRVRGAGSPEDARQTIEELGHVEGQLGADDAALQAFLLAEAFDARQGGCTASLRSSGRSVPTPSSRWGSASGSSHSGSSPKRSRTSRGRSAGICSACENAGPSRSQGPTRRCGSKTARRR
jgi:hypothetical protein